MRQPFKTDTTQRLDTEAIPSSHVYEHLQTYVKTLPNHDAAQACKSLIEAISHALLKGESHEGLVKRISGERRKKPYTFATLSTEKAKTNIAEIKRLRAFANARPLIPGARKLERYHPEIMVLYQAGASLRDIKFWLLSHKKLIVSHHSVQRYLEAVSADDKTK